jgi:large subunit ribosomal protein L10
MSKYVKGLIKNELVQKFEGVNDFVVVSLTGIDGNDNNEMRGDLKGKGIGLTMVKNSLMRVALERLGATAAVGLFLAGPCSVAYGGDSVVDVAKELSNWAKKATSLDMRGAYVDGVIIDGEGAKALAKMPNRVELQGQIVMLANSPGASLAGAIAGPGGAIAGCIKSLVEKLEESEAA